MRLSENQLRLLRKMDVNIPKGAQFKDLTDTTSEDREAFPELKASGLVRGDVTKDGITGHVTENGRELLREIKPWARLKRWFSGQLTSAAEDGFKYFLVYMAGLGTPRFVSFISGLL